MCNSFSGIILLTDEYFYEVASSMQSVVYIGDNLKRLRTQNALTQAQLARRANVALATVARIERNEVEPHLTNVKKLADALGVHPSVLIGD